VTWVHVSIELELLPAKVTLKHTTVLIFSLFPVVYSNPNPIKLITLSTGQIWDHPKKTPKDFVNAWEVEIEHKLPQNVYTLPFTFFCPIFLSGKGL
jgi:hypothetical protein